MSVVRLSVTRRIGLGFVWIVLFCWTALPIFHMLKMGVSPDGEIFGRSLWPDHPTLRNFWFVLSGNHDNTALFWRQLWNSVVVGVGVTVLVLGAGSLASFAITRLRPRWGGWLSNAALATYVIPTSFLAVPLYQVMASYGLLDTRLSLILSLTAFASPYAIWVLSQYATASLPYELDESARIDGATSWQLFWHVFLPLIRPVLVAIGTYALLLAWNEYLLAFLLLSTDENMTLPVAIGAFLNTDQVPWNVLMATSLIYAVPPVVIYTLFRNQVTSGLTTGGVKH